MVIVTPKYERGSLVWHVTGHGPGVVVGWRVTGDEDFEVEVRWHRDDGMADDVHAEWELVTEKPINLT